MRSQAVYHTDKISYLKVEHAEYKDYLDGDLKTSAIARDLLMDHFSLRQTITVVPQNFSGTHLLEKGTNQIVISKALHRVGHINQFLESINEQVKVGTMILGCANTAEKRKKQVLDKFIYPLNYLVYFFDFIFHRILPKFSRLTAKLYYGITKGKSRVLPKSELLGRLYACGFTMVAQGEKNGTIYFVAQKKRCPHYNLQPSYGPVFRMRRVGRNGRIIHVYKLRTMHAYSEYIQEYVTTMNGLAEGGKMKDDFRITSWGKWLRKLWIDELPMLINLVKGDMKLIGVRPISKSFFSLYTEEAKQLRTQVKSGLLPPFYADMPKTLPEIIASEKKYILAYMKRPVATDFIYLLKILRNIVVKRNLSK